MDRGLAFCFPKFGVDSYTRKSQVHRLIKMGVLGAPKEWPLLWPIFLRTGPPLPFRLGPALPLPPSLIWLLSWSLGISSPLVHSPSTCCLLPGEVYLSNLLITKKRPRGPGVSQWWSPCLTKHMCVLGSTSTMAEEKKEHGFHGQ